MRFHGRDVEALAERVEGNRIVKGVTVRGMAVVVEIVLQKRRARLEFLADGEWNAGDERMLRVMAESMLGLRVDPSEFEQVVCEDAMLGEIVRQHRGLRIPQTGTVFEAITWAVMGQQISVGFALTLRRAFIRAAGVRHSSGLWCYPDAAATLRVTDEELGKLKFSRAKAGTILRIARMVEVGELLLETWREEVDHAHVERELLKIKGVGPWTAHYTMLRGIGAADCSLHGDAAVRNNMARLRKARGKISVERAEKILRGYRPWRSLAAAHLWASKRLTA
ncbi:MAG: DNA-3-methyladenine glycosylase 2 [Phycisphaerae bacterium]